MITRCNLSDRYFLLMLGYCRNFSTIRYVPTRLNRMVADKLNRVILAKNHDNFSYSWYIEKFDVMKNPQANPVEMSLT